MSGLGKHRILDYWGCEFAVLDDLDLIRSMFEDALRISNATVLNMVFHKFSPQGVTGVAAIAESHISIHTWPELGFAAVDVFSCGEKMNIDQLLAHFDSVLKPETVEEQNIVRGTRRSRLKAVKP